MGHQKQPVYIHELNEYSMTYYIIFWYFHVVLLVRLMEHEDLATQKSEYVSFLHPGDDAAGCCLLLLLLVYQRIGSSCFVND